MSDTENPPTKPMQTPPLYTNHHTIKQSPPSQPTNHGPDPDPDPDPFPITGASVTPISVGSKLLNHSPIIHHTPKYKQCLKNHAANMGGHITDGCCEFMPSGDAGTLEALKCAACNCHRNFHRKEYPIITPHPLSIHHNPNWVFGTGGAATESSSEELNFTTVGPTYGVMKKRFRTKFTQDQKEKMLEFAEKVGWRIPREDDPEVQRFCSEVGVKRHVLKVWMHNNKATSGKKQVQDSIDESIK